MSTLYFSLVLPIGLVFDNKALNLRLEQKFILLFLFLAFCTHENKVFFAFVTIFFHKTIIERSVWLLRVNAILTLKIAKGSLVNVDVESGCASFTDLYK